MKTYRGLLFVFFLSLCVFINACSQSSTISPDETNEIYKSGDCYDAPGRVIVAFEKEVPNDSILTFISDLGLKIHGDIYGINKKWMAVDVSEGIEGEWIITLLSYEIVADAEREKICPVD